LIGPLIFQMSPSFFSPLIFTHMMNFKSPCSFLLLLCFTLFVSHLQAQTPTVSSLQATGTGIKWYSAASGGILYTGTEALVDGQSYFASQTVNGCESTTRLEVTAHVNPQPQGSLSANGPFCVSGTGMLTWTKTAGTGPFTVVYHDGTANRTASGVTSGTPFAIETNPVTSNTTFTLVSVQDANCTRSSDFTGSSAAITVHALPTPTFTAEPGATANTNTELTYTTQSGKLGYAWTFPGTITSDYIIISGGTSADNTVTLKYITTGSKTVSINYNDNGCTAASPTSSTATSVLANSPCGAPITIAHVTGAVAPVNKTVTYGTVTNVPGEPTKCWITSNLGADHHATAVSDATEASAGWYWQFNHKQGFKVAQDGITRTPNTTWITGIDENSNWTSANDPCNIELGAPWRIPTETEWNNFHTAGSWPNWNDFWLSPLKLHGAGLIYANDGGMPQNQGLLQDRGDWANYWSSTQVDNIISFFFNFYDPDNFIDTGSKGNGYSIRCIRD
jgi:hypothetical protein